MLISKAQADSYFERAEITLSLLPSQLPGFSFRHWKGNHRRVLTTKIVSSIYQLEFTQRKRDCISRSAPPQNSYHSSEGNPAAPSPPSQLTQYALVQSTAPCCRAPAVKHPRNQKEEAPGMFCQKQFLAELCSWQQHIALTSCIPGRQSHCVLSFLLSM